MLNKNHINNNYQRSQLATNTGKIRKETIQTSESTGEPERESERNKRGRLALATSKNNLIENFSQ